MRNARWTAALKTAAAWWKQTLALLLCCAGSAKGADVTLAWDRHSSHTNLSAYVLKYGGTSGSYTGLVTVATNLTSATVSNLTAGRTYYFAVTARDTSGLESDPSNQVSANTPAAPNTPPVAVGSTLQLNEDQSGPLTLSASDADGDSLSYVILTSPASGTLGGTPPNLSYIPNANFFGSDSLTFRVTDGLTNSGTATITITVVAVNDAPGLAALGNLTLSEDAAQQTVSLSGISSGGNENQTLTVTAASSNPSLIPHPTVNYSSPSATGTLTFTPVANANGTATITVTVSDGQVQNSTVTRTFSVTVNSVNDAPTLASISNLAINEDAPQQTVSLSGITSGAANENQILSVTASSSSVGLIPHPTVNYTSPNGFGAIVLKPVTNANGTATVTVTVSDGQSQNSTVTHTFNVTVNAVNDLPTISNIPDQTILQNGATAALGFTVADTETSAGGLTVSATSSDTTLVPSGNIVLGGTGTSRNVTVTPASNQSGSAVVTVSVSDGVAVVTDSFSLTVTPVNQPPTINPLVNLTIPEDAGLQTVSLSGITAGAGNESQTVTITTVSSDTGLIPHPSVSYTSPNSSGAITFSPMANAIGTATITVTANDGQSQVSRNFIVTVTSVNDAPYVSDIPDQSITQNGATGTIPFTVSDAETSAAGITVNAVSSNPTLVPSAGIVLGGSGANRTVRVTPSANQFGSAIITVTAADGTGGLASDVFNLTVTSVNFPPTLDPLVNLAISEDAGAQTVTLSGIGSGSASENQTLVVSAVSNDPNLVPNPTVDYASPNAAGTLSFAAANNAHGTAVITVTVSDGQAQNGTISKSFEVAVSPVNDAPGLNPIANVTLDMDTTQHLVPLSGIGAGAANENQTLTLVAVSSDPSIVPDPTVNYFSPNATGSLLLLPQQGVSGTATITVTVNDAQSENNTVIRTFTVTIRGGNVPPVITDIADRSLPMNGSPVQIPFVVEDAETAAANLQVVASSSNPSLVAVNNIVLSNSGSNRLATIRTTSGQAGVTVITLTVVDADNASASDSFVVTVVAPNSRPTLDSLTARSLSEDAGTQTIELTGISDGSTNENQTLTITAVSSNPNLVPHPIVNYANPDTTGTLVFTPKANGSGSAVVTVTINDGQSQNNLLTRSFTVSITAVNDAPTVSSVPNQQLDHNTASAPLPFVIGDAETSPSSLGVSASSSDVTLFPQSNVLLGGSGANRTIKVTPATGYSGTAIITIVVTDNSLSAVSSFLVTVGSTNTAPVLIAPSSLATDSYTPLQNVPVKVTDLESRSEDLVLSATSYNQTVLPSTNITLSGTGSNRTVTFKPVPGKSGEVSVSFAVTDGRALTRTLCQLTVQVGTPPKAKLNVRRKGKGDVEPALDGHDLTIGQSYTMKAIPASDEVFIGWSGSLTSMSPSLTFIMRSNLVIEAGFTNNPFIDGKGTYNGLFHEIAEVRQESSGAITLTETDRGTFTGKLKTGGRSYSLSGRLDLSCKATNIIVRKGENSLRVEFDFSSAPSNQVVGRVTDGIWEAPLLGDRSVFNSRTQPSPYAGSYTLVVPGQDQPGLAPQGDGMGSLKIDANGLVTFAGTLADGSKVSQRVALSAAGQWPLYIPLYSGGGSILSWMIVTNRASEDLTGLLSWIKPALAKAKQFPHGFTIETFVTGSVYVKPTEPDQTILNLPEANLAFSGGDLSAEINHLIQIGAKSKVTNLSSNRLKMAFSLATGLFSGSSVDSVSGRSLRFNGAVLQKQNAGYGFLLGTNVSSRVTLSE
jgi:hypothetical protein